MDKVGGEAAHVVPMFFFLSLSHSIFMKEKGRARRTWTDGTKEGLSLLRAFLIMESVYIKNFHMLVLCTFMGLLVLIVVLRL